MHNNIFVLGHKVQHTIAIGLEHTMMAFPDADQQPAGPQDNDRVSPPVLDALEQVDLIPYSAEDLEGISRSVEPEVDLVTFSIVNAGPLTQADAATIAARLRSDHEPPVEYLRIEQCDMAGFQNCQAVWDAIPDAAGLKVFSATSCNFHEEETVCYLFEKLSVSPTIQDIYFRDVGRFLPESTTQLSSAIGRLFRRRSDSLRLISLACNEHVDIDLHLESGLRSMPNKHNLQHLNLWMNALGDDRIIPIVNAMTTPGWKLRSLDLAENNLTSEVLPCITNLMHNCRDSLRLLRLSDNPRLLSMEEAKPQDVQNFVHALRLCTKMHSLSLDQCGVDGDLAWKIFDSCSRHGESPHSIPLRQICMQNNPTIGQETWRRIIHNIIPRLSTLKLLFVSDFVYEAGMQDSFNKNMTLEGVEPAWFTSRSGLDVVLEDILARNRLRNLRYWQTVRLLRERPHASRALQAAALNRLVTDGITGKAGVFLLLSHLVETTQSPSSSLESLPQEDTTPGVETSANHNVAVVDDDGGASTDDDPVKERPNKRQRSLGEIGKNGFR